MMVSTSITLGAAVLIIAGLYQWTPYKNRCLRHCRSPVEFLSAHWRKGSAGAFRMGVEHGLYCVGCCWALMALLFVGGVMNLLVIAAIAVFVLIEKVAPQGRAIGRATAAVLVMLGIAMIITE
jgi:predicted metal-binding membrane protein